MTNHSAEHPGFYSSFVLRHWFMGGRMKYLLAVGTLWMREIVRFVRQRNRIVGALGTPLVFWLIIGSGLGSSFKSGTLGGEHYLEYSFPGTLALFLLFTSLFSTISIIEDRQGGVPPSCAQRA